MWLSRALPSQHAQPSQVLASTQCSLPPFQDEPWSQLCIYQFLIELMFTHDYKQMINLSQSLRSQRVRRSLLKKDYNRVPCTCESGNKRLTDIIRWGLVTNTITLCLNLIWMYWPFILNLLGDGYRLRWHLRALFLLQKGDWSWQREALFCYIESLASNQLRIQFLNWYRSILWITKGLRGTFISTLSQTL